MYWYGQKCSCSLYNRALSSSSYLVTLNLLNSCTHLPVTIISMVTTIRYIYGLFSPCENLFIMLIYIVFCPLLQMSVDHQSVQEPVSPRLAKGYSPEGCCPHSFFVVFFLSFLHLFLV